MSKICEKCGNVIPEDVDVCPTCGSDGIEDDALKSVLSELGLSLEDEAAKADEDTDQTIRIPVEEVVSGGEEDAAGEEPTIVLPDLNAVKQESEDAVHQVIEKSKPKAAKPKNPAAKPGAKPQRPANTAQRSTNGKKKKRRKKKNNAAMIGVLIGLVIALLLIGCGVAFMLYQMGFFVQMSDDELLQTPGTSQTQDVLPSPSPSQTPEEPSAEEELSAATGENSTLEEAPVATPEPEEELNCTKFTITGTEYIFLYSRGETTEPAFVIEPSEYRNKIEWSSSDETIATVNSLGVISARRGGTCTITGECGGKSVTVYVTCQFTVPDTVLDMNMEDITMSYEGQTVQLAIDYELTQEQIDYTVWESSDPAVAMVDENGLVTAVSNGTAVITASIADYTASCIVRCVDVAGNKGFNSDDSEYVINYEDVTLTRKGEYFQLTLKSVLGKEVPDFSWASDDTSVAKVDSKGVVTAVSDGTAYITTQIGQDKFRCIVRVNISD